MRRYLDTLKALSAGVWGLEYLLTRYLEDLGIGIASTKDKDTWMTEMKMSTFQALNPFS